MASGCDGLSVALTKAGQQPLVLLDGLAAYILSRRGGRVVDLVGQLAQGLAHAPLLAHQSQSVAPFGVQTEQRPPQPLVARVDVGQLPVQLQRCFDLLARRVQLGQAYRSLLLQPPEVFA